MNSFLPFLLATATAAASTAPLTFDDALTRAAEANPLLLAHSSRIEAADARTAQARLRPRPEVGISLENFAGTGAVRGLSGFEGTVELSQTLERGSKREHRIAAADQTRAVAHADEAVARAEILGNTAQAYIAAVVATERVALARELADWASAAFTETEKRHQAGAAPATEPARARIAAAAAEAAVARELAALDSALAVLAANWGGSGGERLSPTGGFKLPETLPGADRWLDGIDSHPRLAASQVRTHAAQARVSLEQAAAATDVRVAAGLRHLRLNSDTALVAGISLPLPSRERNRAAVRAARHELAVAGHDADAVGRALRAEMGKLLREVAAQHDAATRHRRDVIPVAAEAVAILHRANAAGEAAVTDLLDAERTFHELRRELFEFEAACAAAIVRADALADPSFTTTRQLFAAQ